MAIRAEGEEVLTLPRSGAHLVIRQLPGQPWRDASACYPLFGCPRWEGLGEDLEDLRATALLTVSLVTDPLTAPSEGRLRQLFDYMQEFKPHFLVELPRFQPSRHHNAEARRALRKLEVVELSEPGHHAEAWCELYAGLMARKRISGAAAFSPTSLRRQLHVSGVRVFAALRHGQMCGMQLWYRCEDRAYYHLAASSEVGYRNGAAYALMHSALHTFAAEGLREANLGGVPDGQPQSSGLDYFKRGWANGTGMAHVCGKILQPERYRALSGKSPAPGYFPAYRRPHRSTSDAPQ